MSRGIDKGSWQINEDELLVTGNLWAVFDGATSLVGYEDERGETGGRIAAATAAHAFLVSQGSLHDAAVDANTLIRQAMSNAGIDSGHKEALWATAVAAVRLVAERLEYLTIGNCVVLGIRRMGPRPVDAVRQS